MESRPMTMPHERLRAIGWGEELLQTIQHDLSIPEQFRADAKAIAAAYLSASELLKVTLSGVRDFPAAGADAIERARVLFEALQLGRMGNGDVKRDCLYTLRHFPRSGWGKIAINAARLGKLDEWLAPEDPSH